MLFRVPPFHTRLLWVENLEMELFFLANAYKMNYLTCFCFVFLIMSLVHMTQSSFTDPVQARTVASFYCI